ncbi:protein roadkill-like [Tigriopus californicus]|uniref:protein roadkill-like n=1 Tax=Tigriopus californicus TaxID=6832 RepID=UPI0027D9F2E8|nr:protein roadkill-like [Tigriopus californicus]
MAAAAAPVHPVPSCSSSARSGENKRKRSGSTKAEETAELPPATNFTEIDLDHFSQTHDIKIRNFKQCIHEDPTFVWQFANPNHVEDSYKFRITLRSEVNHRGGMLISSGLYMTDGFILQVSNQSQKSINYILSAKILDEDGLVKITKTERFTARDDAQFTMVSFSSRYDKYISPQGTLFMQVKLDIRTGISYRSTSKRIRMDEPRCRLFKTLPEDIRNMREEANFNDVCIKCGDVIMRCSKFILCARSDVFRAMFSHEMKEARELQIRIEDVEPATLKDMLEFLYSDDVKGIGLSRTVKLLPLAEKYNIRSLCNFCVEALSTHITVEHAGEIAVLAEQHQIRPLLEKTINFMLINATRVVKTEGWRSVLQLCPEIANQIICSLSKHREDTSISEIITEDVFRRHISREREYLIDYPGVYVAAPPNNPEEEILPQFHVQPGNLEIEAADHVVDVDMPGLNVN